MADEQHEAREARDEADGAQCLADEMHLFVQAEADAAKALQLDLRIAAVDAVDAPQPLDEVLLGGGIEREAAREIGRPSRLPSAVSRSSRTISSVTASRSIFNSRPMAFTIIARCSARMTESACSRESLSRSRRLSLRSGWRRLRQRL